MKAFETNIQISKNGKIEIPEEVVKLLPKGKTLRAIFLVDEANDIKFHTTQDDLHYQEFSYSFPVTEGVYDDY